MKMKSRTEQQIEAMNSQKEQPVIAPSEEQPVDKQNSSTKHGLLWYLSPGAPGISSDAPEIENKKVFICKYCKSPLPAISNRYRFVCPYCCRDQAGYGPKTSISDGIRLGFGMFIMLPVVITVTMLLLAVLGFYNIFHLPH
jgi:hypothetical protein